VPPLALHTLVQNSVKHVGGRAPRADGDPRPPERATGRLRLGVWDAGAPFRWKPRRPATGSGLQARLTVLSARKERLAVESADGGKAVSLSFPLRSDS